MWTKVLLVGCLILNVYGANVVTEKDDQKIETNPKELGLMEAIIATFHNPHSNPESTIKETRQSKWYSGYPSNDEENAPKPSLENRQGYESTTPYPATTHNFHDYFTTPTTTTTTTPAPGSGTARTAAQLLHILHALRASGILRSEIAGGNLPLDSRSVPSSTCGCDEEIQQLQHSIMLLQESVRQLRNVVHADEIAQFHGDTKPSQ